MSLLDYEKKFSKLNLYSAKGKKHAHKVAMLLAVMDLIDNGTITENRIEYSDALKTAFIKRFDDLGANGSKYHHNYPFFHLRGPDDKDRFWHHRIKSGQQASYDELDSARSREVIDQHIAYAYLDNELFEWLIHQDARELLARALYENLPDLAPPPLVDGWNWIDCEHCIQAYLEDMDAELRGEARDHARRLTSLAEKISDQTKDSITLMHQRISAVLVGLGFTYLPEYTPLHDDQERMRGMVLAHLAGRQGDLAARADSTLEVAEAPTPFITDWKQILDNEPPQLTPAASPPQRPHLARYVNYSQREAANQILGTRGEEFVVSFEQERLRGLGREDLAKEVEWSSKKHGDGLGYDVCSFLIGDDGTPRDEEHFIEVKTTNHGKYQPFYITDNELAFSRGHEDAYSLYRVYDFRSQTPHLFQLRGQVDAYAHLHPTLYRAGFKDFKSS